MEIKENECMSAVFAGVQGAANWLGKQASDAMKFVKAKLLNLKALAKGLKENAKKLLEKTKEKIVTGYKFLSGWFQDDPVGATAGILAGGLAVGVGVSLVSGGALIGSIGGAGIGAAVKIGSLISGTGSLLFGIQAIGIGSFLVEKTRAVYNFNWNISIEEIKAQQAAAAAQVVSQLGETAGRAIGGLTCGAIAGLATVEINAKVLAQTWYLIKDDTREEILDAFTDLIRVVQGAAAAMSFLEGYKNIRSWIKNNVRFGITRIDKAIESWGTSRQPWTFAGQMENFTDSIGDTNLRAFTENLIEGIFEGCSTAVAGI